MSTTLHKTKAFQDAAKACVKMTRAKLRKLGYKGEFTTPKGRKERAFDEWQSAKNDGCEPAFVEYLRLNYENANR